MARKEVIKKLTDDGWVVRGIKASHQIYTHQYKGGHISVPHPKKILELVWLKNYLN